MRLKLLLMTNMKSHIGFSLTPRSMTLDDLVQLAISSNFSKFRRYSLDDAEVCCNLSYRPIIALFSCFDKKNE